MYLVLVEEVDNQWIVSVNARFICWIPLGSHFHSIWCPCDSIVRRSCLPHGWSYAMYLVLVEGFWANGFIIFFSRTVVVVPVLHRLVLRWWWRLVKDVSISR